MGELIVVVIVIAVIWGVMSAAKVNTANKALIDAFQASHRGWEVYVCPKAEKVIALDHEKRRLAIGSIKQPVEVPWSDIAACEIERNGQSLTATNRGSQAMGAAVGAVLLGPAGLLLGGLTGSKRSVEKVNILALKVTLDHRAAPVHRIEFINLPGNGLKADNAGLKPIVERVERFHALISNAIRSQEQQRQAAITAPSAALLGGASDQIERLWALHQSGALTAEEFANAKGRLLSTNEVPRLT